MRICGLHLLPAFGLLARRKQRNQARSLRVAKSELCGKEWQDLRFDPVANVTRMRSFVGLERVRYAKNFEPFVQIAGTGQQIVLKSNIKRNCPEASNVAHVLIQHCNRSV